MRARNRLCLLPTPRPAGRGKKIAQPCSQTRRGIGFKRASSIDFKDAADQQAFFDLNADLAVVVAYGLILPQVILDAPQMGCWKFMHRYCRVGVGPPRSIVRLWRGMRRRAFASCRWRLVRYWSRFVAGEMAIDQQTPRQFT